MVFEFNGASENIPVEYSSPRLDSTGQAEKEKIKLSGE
jgi:hypothetical protein